jgi:hypothetical protein
MISAPVTHRSIISFRFPFDRIKIDQSFVRELGKRADCIAIVRAATALGRGGCALTGRLHGSPRLSVQSAGARFRDVRPASRPAAGPGTTALRHAGPGYSQHRGGTCGGGSRRWIAGLHDSCCQPLRFPAETVTRAVIIGFQRPTALGGVAAEPHLTSSHPAPMGRKVA